jgi:hypothetical protein
VRGETLIAGPTIDERDWMRALDRVLVTSLLLLALACVGFASAGEPETVYIDQGGHYASGPNYIWGKADLWVNLTVVSGGDVDLYIMNADQYGNAYPEGGGAPNAISYKPDSVEGVQTVNLHVAFNPEGDIFFEEAVYVVVDNRDCAITPDDAVPTGLVRATLEVDWQADDYYELFPELGVCIVALVIFLVIILALIYLVYRSTRARRERESQYYQQTVPPPYWQPPPAAPPEPPPKEQALDPRVKSGEGG